MNIALDYDKTYDADPGLWESFIETAGICGHQVIIVTLRNGQLDTTPYLEELGKRIPVYYTDGLPKREALLAFNGKKIDIWIDDRPETIVFGSYFDAASAQAWREGNKRMAAKRALEWSDLKVHEVDPNWAA